MKNWLLFDLDGTLTDPMIGITSSVQYALRKFGIEEKYLRNLIPFIGPPLKQSFERFYHFSSEQADEAVAYYREYFSPKGIFENEVYEGMIQILRNLEDAGFEMALATSKPKVYAERILKHFGMKDFFSYIGGSELDGRRTNKAEVIQHVLEVCHIDPRDALMIGDREHDIIGAVKCGVESIGVLYGYGSRDELLQAGADHIVETPVQLEEEIRRILKRDTPAPHGFETLLQEKEERKKEGDTMVRFAMIGTGKIAERFYQANHFGKDFELTAVYSRKIETAMAFGAGKGSLSYFTDLEEMAASDVFDAVYIASPNCCHYEQSILMMKHGKHVLCEKPLASNYAEAEEMFRVAQEQDVILMEAMRSIYAPSFEKMKSYMGSLGKIRRATFQYCQYSSRYDNFKRGIIENAFNPELSNGALMDIGVYTVASLVALFGAPKSIKACGIRLDNGVDGEGTILMEYEDMIAEAIYSKITNAAVPSQILGEDAVMMIREIENIKDLKICRKKVDQSIHFEQSDNILNHETNAFIQMVKTGTGQEKSREISLETMKVLDEARRQMNLVFPADKK